MLTKAFAQLNKPPSYFFSASAVGYYGSQAGKLLTESSPPGDGFLAEVCVKWESASNLLEKKGARVVHGRFGVVLSPKGGLLAKVLPIFRCGLGGRLGPGTQWMSWISIEDLIRAIDFTRKHSNLAGPFNFTSPNPVTNSEFTKILADSLHRPAFFHIPRSILRFVFGELADEALLSSTRAIPEQLLTSGFSFEHPSLIDYLFSI
ncbi:MAG: TIGR01777 family oxidoreductase [Rhabdochlamydiaceae bacterium]